MGECDNKNEYTIICSHHAGVNEYTILCSHHMGEHEYTIICNHRMGEHEYTINEYIGASTKAILVLAPVPS